MKTGKYISLGEYNNIKIGFGTVDFKNLKTVYLKLNSWVEPSCDSDEYDNIISRSRRKIKEIIYTLNHRNFKPQSIVDLDIRTKSMKIEKRSYMNLEITLYIENQFDIKCKDIKSDIKTLIYQIIDVGLSDKTLFNFHKTKK